jgi:hemolysin activation/secretion protein
MKQINKIITLSVLASSILLGAAPNIGDIEKQIQLPKEVTQQKDAPLIEIGGVKQYAPPMKDDKSGKTIFVKSFKFDGAIHVDEVKLQKLISSYTNRDLTFYDLQEVASIITKEYRDQGYFVARAYLPVQDINKNNGVITIAIIEGNYGEFQLKNNSLVKDSIVQGMIDDAKARDNIVSTDTLERAMIIINDTPGVIVTGANIEPGKEVGTSDIAVTTQVSKAYDGYILADNYGSRYTGKNRVMAGVNFNSLVGIGDKLSFSGLVSNGTDLKNGRVAYSAPLMSNGLRGEVSYSQTEYSLVRLDGITDGDYKGSSKTLDATLTYPIIRTRVENLYTSLTIAKKDLKDEYLNTTLNSKDTKSFNLGFAYDKSYVAFGKNSQSEASVNLTHGKLSFDGTDDRTGANTVGSYTKVNLELANNIALTQDLTLESSLRMQYALGDKNLDGSEDFSIGGAYGVKVYPDGEFSAENGYVFNAELKYKLPIVSGLSSQLGVFYDRGRAFVSNNTNNLVIETNQSLQDIGVGYYASYKDFFGKLQFAWTANSDAVESEPIYNSRILLQAGWVF